MHGGMWLVGFGYALVYIREGRISEAIVAHGVTNAPIAADVLVFGHWHLR